MVTRSMAIGALLFCAALGHASAEEQYCLVGSGNPQEVFSKLQSGCETGDVIYIEAGFTGAIGILCDWTRPIVTAGNVVLCVKGPPRPTRAIK